MRAVFNKKAMLSQGYRAMPQLLLLVWSSLTTFTTSLRVAKLRKPGFRATGAKQNLTQNGHSISVFWSQWKGDKALSSTNSSSNNVGVICWGSDDIASMKDPQIFRGFQIFCGSLFAIPLPALRRFTPSPVWLTELGSDTEPTKFLLNFIQCVCMSRSYLNAVIVISRLGLFFDCHWYFHCNFQQNIILFC